MRCCYINSSVPAKKRLKTRKTTAKKTYVQQHNNNNTHTLAYEQLTLPLLSAQLAAQLSVSSMTRLSVHPP